MATLQTFIQDPDAKLDYSLDWSEWLTDGDSVQTSSWEVSPEGPTLSDNSVNDAGTITTIWFAGGTVNSRYVLTNHIVTVDGREDDRSITVKLTER